LPEPQPFNHALVIPGMYRLGYFLAFLAVTGIGFLVLVALTKLVGH